MISSYAGIEDYYRNTLALGALDDRNQGVTMRRRQDDRVHAAVDRIFYNVDLAAVVRLAGGPVPGDVDAQLFGRRLGAGMDALPEEVRNAFGDDGDDPLAAARPLTGW